MAELIPDDIYERILLTLNVRNLIRCKSVCKSWKSLISGSRFIKAHLNISYIRNENGHKRTGEAVFRFSGRYAGHNILGLSNGLVCIDDGDQLLVGNPSTREGRTVPKPLALYLDSSCWGFGYDSITDDYKVVVGVLKGHGKTCFQVFSLKSNAWNVVREVNYNCLEAYCGVLCNGVIHWVMRPINDNKKQVILSFDLSKHEFKEIPQTDVEECKFGLYLGIMEECLCVCRDEFWVMKKYNDKQSWEMLPPNCQRKFELGRSFSNEIDGTFHTRYWFIGNRKFSGGPTIVESLVSPHLQAENE